MGQYYDIGLQAGRKVAAKVDEFIKQESFAPESRKTLTDGSTIYRWYMKWDPYWFNDERKFVELLRSFGQENGEIIDDEEYFDTSYKLVAVGDEGGRDEESNNGGYELFDELYDSCRVEFPEPFEERSGINEIRLIEIAKNALGELIFGEEGADPAEMKAWCQEKFGISEEEMNIFGF